MKKIFSFIFVAVGLFVASSLTFAQTETEGIELAKSVEQRPDANGVRWITLESYVTGAVKVVTKSIPSDVILVLDVSSSMRDHTYDYTFEARTAQNYTPNQINSGSYYYLWEDGDGEYHEVSRLNAGGGGPNARYRVGFTVNGTTYYLTNSGLVTEEPTGVSGGTVVFNGVLYDRVGRNRLEALKESVEVFINSIYDNAVAAKNLDNTYDGNRVAVISYAGEYRQGETQYPDYPHVGYDDVTDGWVDVMTGKDNLINSVNNMEVGQGTQPYLGLSRAIDNLLDGTPNSKREKANLTVVLFTDGYPTNFGGSGYGYGSGQTRFDYVYANNMLYYGHILKDTYKATVFSVGLLPTDQGNTNNYKRVTQLLDWLSSDYPDAAVSSLNSTTTWAVNGNTVTVSGMTVGSKTSSTYFQLVNADTDLSSIFKSISDQSGGSASSISEDAVVEVDVVSSSFSLPAGSLADDYEPELYIARCIGYDSDGKGNAFATEANLNQTASDGYVLYKKLELVSAPNKNMTNELKKVVTEVEGGDDVITYETTQSLVKITPEGNEIQTDGFDFATNFCGRHSAPDYITTANPEGFYAGGYKLIIKIPITVNEAAVGGAGTNTNEEDSGIKVNGVIVKRFPRPTVELPINIWVMKTGLEPYESAQFSVYRAPLQFDTEGNVTGVGTYETTPYTSFILTGKLNEETMTKGGESYTGSVIRLLGLDSHYSYKVVEDEWGWQYTGNVVDYDNTYQLDMNPMIFTNALETTDVLHAESKAANDFKEATAITYSSRHYGEAETH